MAMFRFAPASNSSLCADIMTATCIENDWTPIFCKISVQLCRLAYAERSGRQLALSAAEQKFNNMNWAAHMTAAMVDTLAINTMQEIASSGLPTLVCGLDETSSVTLKIWRMVATEGKVLEVARGGRACVADDIHWPRWRVGLIRTSGVELNNLQPVLPTGKDLFAFMTRLATTQGVLHQFYEGLHMACSLVGMNYKQVPTDAQWPGLDGDDLPLIQIIVPGDFGCPTMPQKMTLNG